MAPICAEHLTRGDSQGHLSIIPTRMNGDPIMKSKQLQTQMSPDLVRFGGLCAARRPGVRWKVAEPSIIRRSAMVLAGALMVSIVLASGAVVLASAAPVQLPPQAGQPEGDEAGISGAQAADAALPACGQSDAPPLSVIPFRFHEDSSIQTRIDLNALNVEDYASLAVQVAREDGVDYRPLGPSFSVGAQLQTLTPGGCFDRAFSQLTPGKTYDICLIGLRSDFTSTGLFACVSVPTASKKRETALLITNPNTRSIARTIDAWEREVTSENPDLDLRRVHVSPQVSVRKLWDTIRAHYLRSNLTTVILGSSGLPLPVVDNFGAQVPYSGVYTSLSRGFMVDDGFLNPTNPLGEVSIATWNAPPTTIGNYLSRVIEFYRGSIAYDQRLLVGNAMIPSEGPLVESDFVDDRYPADRIDYVGGITAYLDDTEGPLWRDRYLQLLATRSYELVLLNAHGAPTFHYPCDSAGCVDFPLIRDASPQAQFVVAVSCNIGNLGSLSTPMTAYVFESQSLGGLASEVTFFSGGSELLDIKSRLSEGASIGQAGRRFGLTAFGDPFLRLR